MIAAVDVYYDEITGAAGGAVIFSSFSDSKPFSTYYISGIKPVEKYISGQFYLRELPCIMALIGEINEVIDTVIIDGYVDPGNKPGLGRYLWNAYDGKIAVIGVAKTFYAGTDAERVFRGKSCRPLYITSAGIDSVVAAGFIKDMEGKFRIPDMLKIADRLSRTGIYQHISK